MVPAIKVEGLGKRFRTYTADRPYTLQEAFVRGFRDLRKHSYFWALREINFDVLPGRITGVIGRNGSGKSTLLRLVGGVIEPDAGQVTVNGNIGALIDLGVGFHPELTGRENLNINAVISGLTRKETARRLDEIIHFAELEAFVDSPLRTYSTGMQMRLGFSIAIHTDPQVLLVDEVLAVGDAAFQEKCLERIAQIKQQGAALLLVSHDTSLVNRLCDEAVWLKAGEMAAKGTAEEVTRLYQADIQMETIKRTPGSKPARSTEDSGLRLLENRIGSLEMEITRVWLLDSHSQEIGALESGNPLSIELTYWAPNRVKSPIFTASIIRSDGVVCLDSSTQATGVMLPDLQGRGRIKLNLDWLALTPGRYSVEVGVFQHDWAYAYDFHSQAYPLVVVGAGGSKGVLATPQHWELLPEPESGPTGE